MLVTVQENTKAGMLHRGSSCAPGSETNGLTSSGCLKLRNQSQVEANDGSRNPRKASSSQTGASRVPNRATIHTSAGVRKKSSMGSVLGMGRKFDKNWTARLKTTPPANRGTQRRRKTEKFQRKPCRNGCCHRYVKMAHTMAPAIRYPAAMLGMSRRGSRTSFPAAFDPNTCHP